MTSGTGSLHWLPATSGTRQVVFVLDAECLLPAFEVSLATYLLSFIPYLLRIFLTLYNIATHQFVIMLGLSGMSRQTLSHLHRPMQPLKTLRRHTYTTWLASAKVPISLYRILHKSPFVNDSREFRSHIIPPKGSSFHTTLLPHGLIARMAAAWQPQNTSLYIARFWTSTLEHIPNTELKCHFHLFSFPLTIIGNGFKISMGKPGTEIPWMLHGPGVRGLDNRQIYFIQGELCWDETTKLEDRFVSPSNIAQIYNCTWDAGMWRTRSAMVNPESMKIGEWEEEKCGCFEKFTCLDNYDPIEHSAMLDCGNVEVKWALEQAANYHARSDSYSEHALHGNIELIHNVKSA